MTFRLGKTEFQGAAVLAPLASITSAPFRQICLEHGCSYAVTEMIASEALVRDVRGALTRMIRAPSEHFLVVQIFGSNPATMARAASLAVDKAGAAVVDVNMGCPVRKILGSGSGVALMRDPERAEAIVRALVGACGASALVTVKMRAGWDDSSLSAPELAKRLEGAGAAGIAIHARTRDQVHSGQSRWEVVAEVKRSVSVPVIGNGGIKTAAQARTLQQQTGCDAIMIGRGALGNPWIFRELSTGCPHSPSVPERFAVLRRHLDLYIDYAGERVAAREMRKHLCWYLRGLAGSALVRSQLQTLSTAAEIEDVLGAFEQALLQGATRASAQDFAAPDEIEET